MTSNTAVSHVNVTDLESLPGDALYRIAQCVQAQRRSGLHSFSSTSRTIRSVCIPLLFARSHILCDPAARKGNPPEWILPYVKDLICLDEFATDSTAEDSFRCDLNRYPNLQYVRFDRVLGGVPWGVINACLSHPKVTSIEMDFLSRWYHTPAFSQAVVDSTPVSLTRFVNHTSSWRDWDLTADGRDRLKAEYDLQSRCLAPLVCNMHDTAESLTLPMETAPLARMAELSWPRIRHLSLQGRYYSDNERPPASILSILPSVLSRMPTLRTLDVRAAQPLAYSRAPILGQASRPPIELPELQSLTIAYPDPNDAIFAAKLPLLRHLSLKDAPRFYLASRSPRYGRRSPFVTPILTASECVAILRKMDVPALESLELVYKVDSADSEVDLLHHVASFYPRLACIELHRYRWEERGKEEVPYLSIVKTLASIRSLQVVYLNLDFPQTPPIQTPFRSPGMRKWDAFRNACAGEIMGVLGTQCPRFECVALLDPRRNCCTWVEYRPAWYPGPKIDLDAGAERHRDYEQLPFA